MINIELYCHIHSFVHCIGSLHQLNAAAAAVAVNVLPLLHSLTIHWVYPLISGVWCVGLSISHLYSKFLFAFIVFRVAWHTNPISIHVRIFLLVPWARSLFMLVWKSVGIVLLTSEQVCCNRLNCFSSLFFVIGIWYNDYNKNLILNFFLNRMFFLSTSHNYLSSSVFIKVFLFPNPHRYFRWSLRFDTSQHGQWFQSLWNCERGAIKQAIYFLFK